MNANQRSTSFGKLSRPMIASRTNVREKIGFIGYFVAVGAILTGKRAFLDRMSLEYHENGHGESVKNRPSDNGIYVLRGLLTPIVTVMGSAPLSHETV